VTFLSIYIYLKIPNILFNKQKIITTKVRPLSHI